MTTTIVITSGKGGVGKTNISVNTALELAQRECRVCLLDADLGLANVNILLGLYPNKNLDDVILEGTPLEEIVVQTEFGVDVIPGSSGVEEMANLDNTELSRLVEGFTRLKDYDYLLIDTSSGISRGVIAFCLAATETLLVLTGEATSLTDAYGLLKVLSLNDYQGTVKILVNKCASVPQAKKTFAHFKSVVDKRLNIKIVPGGVILADSTIEKAVSSQQPAQAFYPKSTFSICIKALVNNLTKKAPEAKNDETCGDFWSRYIDYLQTDLLLPGRAKKDSVQALQKPLTSVSEDNNDEGGSVPANDSSGYPKDSSTRLAEKLINEDRAQINAYLQSPPALLSSVLNMQSRGQLSVVKMREVVACDPALTMRILHVYNLSGPNKHKGVVSIQKVLADVDEQMLARLLLTTATHELLAVHSVAGCAALNTWWAHSLKCGMMAKALAELLDYPVTDAVYLAGLLHDIGRQSIENQPPAVFGKVSSHMDSTETRTPESENTGTCNNGVGADKLAGLNVCSLIVDAVRYHDETEARIATAFDMTKLAFMAHLLSTSKENELSRGVDLATQFFDIPASEVFTCIQSVTKDYAKVAKKYGIPSNGDVGFGKVEGELAHYRQQAIDYVTLQSVLQFPQQPAMSDIICAIHQGLSQIFGINRIVCLVPNANQTLLQAEGYAGCFCEEDINNIHFSLHSSRSLVVAAYHSKMSTILSCKSLQSLADRQVMSILGSEILFCLPLMHPPLGEQKGLILCGAPKSERERYTALQAKLENFATQVALKI